MKKLTLLIFLLLLCVFLNALDSEEILVSALESWKNDIPPESVLAIGNIVYQPGNLSSPYSIYLRETLGGLIQDHPTFNYSNRDNLNQVIQEIKLGLSGFIDEESAAQAGRIEALDYIVTGHYQERGEYILLYLELTHIETALVSETQEFRLEKSSLPPGIAYTPNNYSDALFVMEELAEISSSHGDTLDIRSWTSRGDGGIYEDGEELEIFFFSSQDCYVKVYHIDVNQQISLIFPNEYSQDNFIRAKELIQIPDDRYPFDFIQGAPYGREFIKVIASTTQFEDIEDPFAELGALDSRIITRGLTVQQKEEVITERLFSYNIVE